MEHKNYLTIDNNCLARNFPRFAYIPAIKQPEHALRLSQWRKAHRCRYYYYPGSTIVRAYLKPRRGTHPYRHFSSYTMNVEFKLEDEISTARAVQAICFVVVT